MDLFFSISGFINFLTSFFLGAFVFLRNRENPINRLFGLFCFSLSWWSFFYIFWPLANTENEALASFRLLHLSTFFLSPLYLHFVSLFLGVYNRKNKIIIWTGYLIAFLFLVFSFSSYFIQGVTPKFGISFWGVPGTLYHFYIVHLFGYMIYSNYLLFKEYRKSQGVKRSQIFYILLGIIILYIAGGTNYALWYNINLPPYLNILSSGFVIATAYAIIVHRLMNVKLVLRKSFVYLASIVTILLPIIAIKYFIVRFYADLSESLDFIILVVAFSFFPSIKNFYYRIANKYFFSSLYDSREVISELSDNLRATLEAKKIYKSVSNTLIDSFHTKAVGFLTRDEKTGDYVVKFNNGYNIGNKKRFPGDNFLEKAFMKSSKAIVIEEVKRDEKIYKKSKDAIDLLSKLDVAVVAPLNIKNGMLGIVTLGPKESKEIYNNEDLEVLGIICSQVAIALENAYLYEETKKFNVKLKREVDQATADLRAANEELKRLDAAKSEFISIASHQLRTPLTAIKGFVSLILEGSYGKFGNQQKDVLKKVYSSNERLIQLVEDLLNLSRIESGRMEYNMEKTNLGKIITEVTDTLSLAAKNKKLKLEVQKPKKELPEINVDASKIREVISNLVDNAIKYTQEGKIMVASENNGKVIRITVADTGMGMSEEDKTHLFSKFSRGEGMSKVHTEGTGLGLYVGKKLVEAHGGKIWAESEGKGKGSRFIVELPIK